MYNNVVVLLSGGLDSCVMLDSFVQRGWAARSLFVNYGQINLEMEKQSSQRIAKNYGSHWECMDIHGFGQLIPSGLTNKNYDIVKNAFLPGRNLLFLLMASSYAVMTGSGYVAIGLLSEKYSLFPDQRRGFIEVAESCIQAAMGIDIKVLVPLFDLSKQDVIAIAQERKVSGTYSCHAGTSVPCGNCIACLEFKRKEG